MIRNYFTTALRNMVRNKVYSFLNISGLAVGMAVAMLIGLWIYDEFAFNTYHTKHERIVKVMQNLSDNGAIQTLESVPYPLAEELRNKYGSDFKQVALAMSDVMNVLRYKNNTFTKQGTYFEPQALDILSVKLLKGNAQSLDEPTSIILSASLAKSLFTYTDPLGKIIQLDDSIAIKVTGVYEDFPASSSFHEVSFIAPWQLYYNLNPWVKELANPWRVNAFQIYAQVNSRADIDNISLKIKDASLPHVPKKLAKSKPALFLHPMDKWYLQEQFRDGLNTGGRIEYVYLFGLIGCFVLLLACINFMNLSTARSEKRAKEVGIRKAVGSSRIGLILQFYSESFIMVSFACILSFLLLWLSLPWFNQIAGKDIHLLWSEPLFWALAIGFSLFTGFAAGTYPALYLSSFRPEQVLKGNIRTGSYTSLPRKILVIIQFTVSMLMINATIGVYHQIEFAKNRPIGYDTSGLVAILQTGLDVHQHFEVVKNKLLQTGAILQVCETNSPLTQIWATRNSVDWPGKDPNLVADFANIGISYEYGATIGWQLLAGRDFAKDFTSDSKSVILNESAIRLIGLKNPIGQSLLWYNEPYQIVGVVKDVISQSPYKKVKPTFYHLLGEEASYVLAKIHPQSTAKGALQQMEAIFQTYNPSQPFDYGFVDEEFAKKFDTEERIGQLSILFTILAIFISCLGVFGLASFLCEQRNKEMGVRKILGANTFHLWALLSKDFIVLVLTAFLIATPLAYYFIYKWLENFEYRTTITWWIFVVAGTSVLVITLLTMSYQTIKSALINPVHALRNE
ncbi:ABC transporter permease [Rhodocytophaga aerolata]|uniref:ABC transporter permease n=1 Tax=Rhodocytophaga aerolata TaxID=455078 RepID=A0ABT8RJ10_9BACT|nr:ABC transporter permease [Rhodocytophaga aerolata]MDO1451374.1 ABC transporter permease [Rhodocytophaga aerolata]